MGLFRMLFGDSSHPQTTSPEMRDQYERGRMRTLAREAVKCGYNGDISHGDAMEEHIRIVHARQREAGRAHNRAILSKVKNL